VGGRRVAEERTARVFVLCQPNENMANPPLARFATRPSNLREHKGTLRGGRGQKSRGG
jgi:uncharacterized protein (DUF362 family)